MTTVVVVDDHPVFRSGVAAILEVHQRPDGGLTIPTVLQPHMGVDSIPA